MITTQARVLPVINGRVVLAGVCSLKSVAHQTRGDPWGNMELHRTVQRTCGIFIEGRDRVVLHALLWLSLGQDLNPNKHKEEIFGSKSKNQERSFK